MTDSTINQNYEPGTHPDLPPPADTVGPIHWIKENLLSSPANIAMTIFSVYFLYLLIPHSIQYLFTDAVFDASSRKECREISPNGACWAFAVNRFHLFMYGFFPSDQYWRVNVAFIGMFVAMAPILFSNIMYRKILLIHTILYPIIAYILLLGGTFDILLLSGLSEYISIFSIFEIDTGLESVSTDQFGGMMLTLVIGITGVAFSLPIGIVLALGRQSNLPILKYASIIFIEFIRGVPLITLLFIATTLLGYFLPEGVTFDTLLRVLIMVTLFASAYIAEVIRGGLQAMPKGQYEAGDALGLTYWQSMRLIILPQALKISIPGIVNTFIGLYKDTTLVVIIGLLDILGMVKASAADIKWNGITVEGYIFVALCFFISCFAMARYSLYLESKLHTGHKR